MDTATSTGCGRAATFLRRVLIVAGVFAAVTGPAAAAQASVPGTRQDRADAKRFARAYWRDRGYETTCYRVRIASRPMWKPSVGRSLGYVRHGRCTIWLNSNDDSNWNRLPHWGDADPWWRVCATVIHEYGHLRGIDRPHNRRPNSVMAIAESINYDASWWPFFPGCRYEGDDANGDGMPDA